MAEKLMSNDEVVSEAAGALVLGAADVLGAEDGEDVCAVVDDELDLWLLPQAAAIRPTPITSTASARVLYTDASPRVGASRRGPTRSWSGTVSARTLMSR
jgi:hypothetical protein